MTTSKPHPWSGWLMDVTSEGRRELGSESGHMEEKEWDRSEWGDGGWKKRALRLAFPWHGEEGCMILVFVLRRICVMEQDANHRLLGWVVWDRASKPRVVRRGRRWHHSAEEHAGKCNRWKKLLGRFWALVLSITARIASCMFSTQRAARRHFGRIFPRSDDVVWRTPSFRNSSLGTQLSAGRKGRFLFFLFCSLGCIKVCVEAP